MNCLFCQQEMWVDNYQVIKTISCNSIDCMVNNDFSRYRCGTDTLDKLCWQEYALGHLYVKVNDNGTSIYRLVSCMLVEEVKVPQALWLNPINLEATLDRLTGLHYILLT